MRKSSLVLLVCLLFPHLLPGQNAEKPVPLDSPIYRWLGDLYTRSGLAFPSHDAPFTAGQVLSLLDDVESHRVAPAGKADTDLEGSIRDALHEKPFVAEAGTDGPDSGLAVSIRSQLNPEFYLGVGQESRVWDYGYNDRQPFAKTLFEAWAFPWLYGAFDMEVRKDPFAVIDESQPISNAPTQLGEVDFQWPYWAGVVAGGPHWDFRFFRSKASFAESKWNLTLSQDAGEVDQIRLSTWWNAFQYTFLWIPVDNTLTSSDQFQYGYPRTVEDTNGTTLNYDKSRNFVTHRIQFRPWDNWSFVFTEILMFESKVFDPRYLNPLMPGHNWFLYANANSDVSLEFEGSPLPGWTIWGQWYGDYIKTAFKDTLYNDPTPAAYGYLAGTRLESDWDGRPVTLEAEGVYTDPFLYLNNHVNMVKTERFLSNYGTPGRRMIDTPFGFELGPDTIAVRSTASVEQPNAWRFEMGFPFQVRGENTIRTMHPLREKSNSYPEVLNPLYGHPELYRGWVTPTGIPEWRQGFSLGWEFGPQLLSKTGLGLPWDSWFGVQSTFTLVWNRDHHTSPMDWDWQSALTWKNSF